MTGRPVTLRSFATLLVTAKRMQSRPRWLDELVAHLGDALPAGPPRNPKALAISATDDAL
jgi:hypothetical protein